MAVKYMSEIQAQQLSGDRWEDVHIADPNGSILSFGDIKLGKVNIDGKIHYMVAGFQSQEELDTLLSGTSQ